MSPWSCSAVLDGQLYTHSRSHWPSTSAFCHSAKVGRTPLSIEQFRSSALFCGGPVDLEFAARQSSWPRTESRYFQTSAEDVHFCEILMTKCIKRIRDLFEYALYKFTLYLLTYLRSNCTALPDTTAEAKPIWGLTFQVHTAHCVRVEIFKHIDQFRWYTKTSQRQPKRTAIYWVKGSSRVSKPGALFPNPGFRVSKILNPGFGFRFGF